MKTLLLLAIFYISVNTLPYNGYGYIPRSIMFGGYYGAPGNGLSRGTPQGTLSFSAGDTIATNTYIGEEYPSSFDRTNNKKDEDEEQEQESSEQIDEESIEVTPSTKKSPPKHKPSVKPSKENSDEEDMPSSWPFQGSRSGVPSYNAFFPIVFGGGNGNPKTKSSEGYQPGGATAIANSFSTGKGGVATSHATSFGDPYVAELLRSGFFNNNNNSKKANFSG